MLLQEVLAFGPVFIAEPVRRILRLDKAPTGVLAAAVVLANVVLTPAGVAYSGFGILISSLIAD